MEEENISIKDQFGTRNPSQFNFGFLDGSGRVAPLTEARFDSPSGLLYNVKVECEGAGATTTSFWAEIHASREGLGTNNAGGKNGTSSRANRPRIHECRVCRKRFTCNSDLTRHERTHTGDRPFKCEICGKCYARRDALVLHMRFHAVEMSATELKLDPGTTSRALALYEQQSIISHKALTTRGRLHECEVCQKSFKNNSDLIRHTRTHTGDKPFKCKQCSKCFSRRDGLTAHNRLHTGERPHTCHCCRKAFLKKWDLQRHLKTHEDHKCEICLKEFMRKVDLVKHSITHSSDRPFPFPD